MSTINDSQPGHDPQLFCLDYSMGSRTMAVCGAEPELRIFDVETKKRTHFLDGKGGYDERGHSNRVFCVKFYKDDPNMLISGGWDNRIVF